MRFLLLPLPRTGTLATALALALSGCMSAGVSDTLRVEAPALDRMTTGSIPAAASQSPSQVAAIRFDAHTDEATVASAVAQALQTDSASQSPTGGLYPWANPITGSTGVISEFRDDDTGVPCRAFTTTIHRYDGIALFEGRACTIDGGQWQMTSLAPRR
jgi:hypothetical protein